MTFIQHIFEVERETGSVLCRIALWEYFGAQPRPQRFSLRKSTRAFSVQVIFPIRLVKMKMERVVRPEIFWNTRTTFRGIPLFPFQPVGTEVPVPCAQFCVGRRLAPRNFRHFQCLSVSVVHGQWEFFFSSLILGHPHFFLRLASSDRPKFLAFSKKKKYRRR